MAQMTYGREFSKEPSIRRINLGGGFMVTIELTPKEEGFCHAQLKTDIPDHNGARIVSEHAGSSEQEAFDMVLNQLRHWYPSASESR